MAKKQEKKRRKKGPRPNIRKKPSRFEDSWFAAFLYTLIDAIFSWSVKCGYSVVEFHPFFHMEDRLSKKGKKRADIVTLVFGGILLILIMISSLWMGISKHDDNLIVLFSACFFLLPVSVLAFVIQKWLILPTLQPRYQLYLRNLPKPQDPYVHHRLDPYDRKPLLYLCTFPYFLLIGFGFTMDFSWLFLGYFMVDGPALWIANGALILAILFEVIGLIAPRLYFFPLLSWMNPDDLKRQELVSAAAVFKTV